MQGESMQGGKQTCSMLRLLSIAKQGNKRETPPVEQA